MDLQYYINNGPGIFLRVFLAELPCVEKLRKFPALKIMTIPGKISRLKRDELGNISALGFIENNHVSAALVPLTVEHAGFIVGQADYKQFLTRAYVEAGLARSFGAAIFENNELVAWGLTHHDGALGSPHVLPAFRGKGCGREILASLVRNQRGINIIGIGGRRWRRCGEYLLKFQGGAAWRILRGSGDGIVMKMLIIDDDDEFKDMLSFYFKDTQGYALEKAGNGREGLQKARLMQPDIIILDVMMPDMGGIEVLRELQTDTDTSGIPVIVLTASVFDNKMSDLFRQESNCREFLPKDIDIALLHKKVILAKNSGAQRQL
jgi:CheY-like chemotaxis protein